MAAFEENGWDDPVFLFTLGKRELENVLSECGMKPGHANKFLCLFELFKAERQTQQSTQNAVSVRTREQRDAAGRKRAIDLDDDAVTTPPQRVRAADDAADLTTRVAKAHSLMQPQVDAAYRALLQPHFSAYAADEIDAAELDRRKQRAHDEAASQHQPALSLNRAHSTYESASRCSNSSRARVPQATRGARCSRRPRRLPRMACRRRRCAPSCRGSSTSAKCTAPSTTTTLSRRMRSAGMVVSLWESGFGITRTDRASKNYDVSKSHKFQ
jgi:hypothetical protein